MIKELQKIIISQTSRGFAKSIEDYRNQLTSLARFDGRAEQTKIVWEVLREIDADTDEKADRAVIKYTKKFDGVNLTPDKIRVSRRELQAAHKKIDKKLLSSIKRSIANVRKYQKGIFVPNKSKSFKNGTAIKCMPLKSVGVYVPAGTAPLPSTVIMAVVPAQVAGVKRIVVVSPPRCNSDIHPVIKAVCFELGVIEVYRVGGVQAIGALASKRGTIPLVDKIVGPGSRWVQTAKKAVASSYAAIESIAGPSEVLIIANESADPAWVAADMLSQAEHNIGCGIVFTTSKKLVHQIISQLKVQITKLGRSKETADCIKKYSRVVVFKNMKDLIIWANEFAPEHLQIQCGKKSMQIASKIENAGAIFVGEYTPVAIGDYWAGPSHILPTGGCARFSSALTSNDFVKSISIIRYGRNMLKKSADDIIRLAEAEGLDAHAKSVKMRLKEG
ncbi:MAG: histidinol dehydrogenase [Sedimentisphaerales bacterium]|nr:histidinol dehydrogenase [Sedimentisphaerales bacterium]